MAVSFEIIGFGIAILLVIVCLICYRNRYKAKKQEDENKKAAIEMAKMEGFDNEEATQGANKSNFDVYKEFSPGSYIMQAQANVTTSDDRESSELETRLIAGDKIEIVEIRLVGDRIRGRLEEGGWISIQSTCDKAWVWARPEGVTSEDPQFEGEMLWNQVWVPAIITVINSDSKEPTYRGTIKPSEEMESVNPNQVGAVYDKIDPSEVHIFCPLGETMQEGATQIDVAGAKPNRGIASWLFGGCRQ